MADEEGRRLTGAVLVVLEQQGIQLQSWQIAVLQQALVTELHRTPTRAPCPCWACTIHPLPHHRQELCIECGEAAPCMNHDPASTWQDRSWSDPVTIEGEALAGQPKGWAPCGCTADSNCNAHGHKPATAWDQRVEAVIEAAGKTECRYCGETGPRCPH